MALWKPFRGNRAALDTKEKHDGYVYFCVDDGSLFFDYTDAEGNLQRKQINAKDAETITGASLSTILNSSDLETPTSKAVLDALETKATKSDVDAQISELSSEVEKYVDDQIAANGEFIVTISGDEESGYTADKTYMEVYETNSNGRPVVALMNSIRCHFLGVMDDGAVFSLQMGMSESALIMLLSDNSVQVQISTTQFNIGEHTWYPSDGAIDFTDAIREEVNTAISQKSQVQIITWEADD